MARDRSIERIRVQHFSKTWSSEKFFEKSFELAKNYQLPRNSQIFPLQYIYFKNWKVRPLLAQDLKRLGIHIFGQVWPEKVILGMYLFHLGYHDSNPA